MKHRVYYDNGEGVAAMLTAAIRLQLLPQEELPDRAHLADFLARHVPQAGAPGAVCLLGEDGGERVYWCGLGGMAAIVVRTWRHFLHLYRQQQEAFTFCSVPVPQRRRWKRGEQLLRKGRREESRQLLAKAAVQEYAVFLTVLMSEWQEG
ncbi:uncharacterized protein DUF3189 [Tumebacillus sp. BK434]|uniref:DUF3189 family protein n=1 Tax=Tumebacillus sp. BK434 TaxID=2512169 RepID=UPI00104E403C|nr:DUF3189 family protein [Tumebacillus sp. BK434]TCP59390.1 uncharacterized protein DUF3189 [Tumebacillus sp. BK434]